MRAEMHYIEGLPEPIKEKKTIVTAGKFDGVHRGHQKLLSRVREIAEEMN